ncbi:MAG: PspC domain-containing protein [candidate division Zixibacteria bacterium]|nr:PspC domain-containing protein [candidate division Zixibacteria bacterium]
MPDKTLYRSASNRMISGICGGLAEYFDVDASVLRIAMVAFTVITLPVFGPFVFLAYLVCVFIIPRDPGLAPAAATDSPADPGNSDQPEQDVRQVAENQPTNRNNSMVLGGLFILLAVIVLTWSYAPEYGRFSFFLPMVPIVAIGAAVFILFIYRGQIMEFFTHRRLYRLSKGKKICGVCSGLADAFNLDPTLVRIGFFIAFLFSVGTVTLIYLFMAFIMPVGRPELPAEDG